MKQNLLKFGMTLALAAFVCGGEARAEVPSALIDALVKKGVLTDNEGGQIKKEINDEWVKTGASKLDINKEVKKLKLYGDARFRYEYDRQERFSNQAGGNVRERNRNRYRLRLGADYTFSEGFSGGIRLATGQSRNSTNVDMGTGNANLNANDTIYVDLVYFNYDNAFGQDWLAMTAGRMPLQHNIRTGWTWDSDINPDGGVVKLGTWDLNDTFNIGSTHGAYIWFDFIDNPFAAAGANQDGRNDVWMFINQIDLGFNIDKDWKLRVSPGFVNFIGDAGQANPGAGAAIPAFSNAQDLDVFFVNASLNTPFFGKLKGKLDGEFGYNISGNDRSQVANPRDGDDIFWNVGYGVSKGRRNKGDWNVRADYAYYGANSWAPALFDSDFHGGLLGGHGFGLRAQYSLTNFLQASLNWRRSWAIDDRATTAGPVATNLDSSDLVQMDLIWRF